MSIFTLITLKKENHMFTDFIYWIITLSTLVNFTFKNRTNINIFGINN